MNIVSQAHEGNEEKNVFIAISCPSMAGTFYL